jgi:AraC-like DNA-binding protein
MPVMQYVGDWRLQLARARLQSTHETVAAVARRVGYQSEATFSRAYKRSFGCSPGSDRQGPTLESLLPAG